MSQLHFCGLEEVHGAHEWEGGRCLGLDAEAARIPPRRLGGYVELAPETVTWGATLCSRRRCAELAVLLLDHWPFCLEHGDEEVERWVAFSERPDLARLMPSLEDQ